MAEPDCLPKNMNLKWIKAICPVCGRDYPYLKDHKPSTCGRFDCIYALAEEALKKRGES